MPLKWFLRRKIVRRTRRRTKADTRHYAEHKEKARELVHARLLHWNQFYNLSYKRVAIRDQRSRWGSCSTKQNLNFNYRILFLPEALVDYIVVHELCHLAEFNHSPVFWSHVEKTLPDYSERKAQLYQIPLNSLYSEAG